VYGAQGCSKATNQLQVNDDLYDAESKTWLGKNNNTGEVCAPSGWKLFHKFSEKFSDCRRQVVGTSFGSHRMLLAADRQALVVSVC